MRSFNLVDIAIRQHGTVEALFDLAQLNGLLITEELVPGHAVQLDTGKVYDRPKPATSQQVPIDQPITRTVISSGQNLVDIALQELGSVEGIFPLAALNGLRITDLLSAGQVLALDPDQVLGRQLVAWYRGRRIRINTGSTRPPIVLPPVEDGMVDFIETDFIYTDFY